MAASILLAIRVLGFTTTNTCLLPAVISNGSLSEKVVPLCVNWSPENSLVVSSVKSLPSALKI